MSSKLNRKSKVLKPLQCAIFKLSMKLGKL